MKKKILFHSNSSKAFTGFGKNAKNILRYLQGTDKYEIVEFANGMQWGDPILKLRPWEAQGSLPNPQHAPGQPAADGPGQPPGHVQPAAEPRELRGPRGRRGAAAREPRVDGRLAALDAGQRRR